MTTVKFKAIHAAIEAGFSFLARKTLAVDRCGALLFLPLLALSSCTNTYLSGNRTLATAALGLPTPRPASEAPMVIDKALRSSRNPTSHFDIVGSDGKIGQYCTATGNTGESNCTCAFYYTLENGTAQNFEAPTTYTETDLLRCSFGDIPSIASSVKIKVHVNDIDAFSNEVEFQFRGNGDTLDTTQESTFSQVQRYQCNDLITVPYLMDPGSSSATAINSVYDPIQSEDPRNTYKLNFYTTNFGQAITAYTGGLAGITAPQGWSCPADISAAASSPEMNIYSLAPDSRSSGTGRRIYPHTGEAGTFDRSNFSLARKPTGVFNIPLNTYIAPGIMTTFNPSPTTALKDGNGLPAIGYGAMPVGTGITGQESCPDTTIQIPSGYRWVKVWLFRMTLPPRKYYYSNNLRSMGDIACHPGNWIANLDPGGATPKPWLNSVFRDCYGAPSLSQPPPATFDPANATWYNNLVARFAFGTGGRLGSCMLPDYNALPNASLNLATGSEKWMPSTTWWSDTGNWHDQNRCGLDSAFDPANVCRGDFTPYDTSSITVRNIDDPNSLRYDFLFIATPTSVHTRDMTDTTSPVHYMYTPYRFMSASDCAAGVDNPDDPTSGCDRSRMLNNYGIKLHDMTTAGDPPADSPNRNGTFPICALQKIN